MTKVLYLIRGVSGSGKTTLAKKITKCNVSADDYFMRNGKYEYQHSKTMDAHAYCLKEVREYMKLDAQEIAVHNTFTRRWELEPYYALAVEYGYEVVEVVMFGNFKNVHGVPLEKVAQQRNRFEL